jgi:hypothetical protein
MWRAPRAAPSRSGNRTTDLPAGPIPYRRRPPRARTGRIMAGDLGRTKRSVLSDSERGLNSGTEPITMDLYSHVMPSALCHQARTSAAAQLGSAGRYGARGVSQSRRQPRLRLTGRIGTRSRPPPNSTRAATCCTQSGRRSAVYIASTIPTAPAAWPVWRSRADVPAGGHLSRPRAHAADPR